MAILPTRRGREVVRVGIARAAARHAPSYGRDDKRRAGAPYTRSAGITLMAFSLSIALISPGVNL
jgi:hypothetical protein